MKIGSKMRLVPPRRPIKNSFEFKQRVLREIFLRIKSANLQSDDALTIQKIIGISNDVYGNDISSSYELEKGKIWPIFQSKLFNIPNEIMEAQKG